MLMLFQSASGQWILLVGACLSLDGLSLLRLSSAFFGFLLSLAFFGFLRLWMDSIFFGCLHVQKERATFEELQEPVRISQQPGVVG
jgi:hypothetical protein